MLFVHLTRLSLPFSLVFLGFPARPFLLPLLQGPVPPLCLAYPMALPSLPAGPPGAQLPHGPHSPGSSEHQPPSPPLWVLWGGPFPALPGGQTPGLLRLSQEETPWRGVCVCVCVCVCVQVHECEPEVRCMYFNTSIWPSFLDTGD